VNALNRRTALTLLAGLPWVTAAAASAGPVMSAPLTYDKDGRPTVPVSINGKGPFMLVTDTGAGGTVLSTTLVQELALSADAGHGAQIQGAAGATQVRLFSLDSLKVGDLVVSPARATELPNGGISDSRGVLGADTFARGRIEYDFAGGLLQASASGATPAGFTAIQAQLLHRVLAVIPARLGGVETPALIDTGARATLANAKMMEALGYAPGDARLTLEEKPTGATGHVMRSYLGGAADLVIGGQTFPGQKLVFIDLPVFQALGMADKPGLILGIDALRKFDAVAIDYPRGEVQLRPRR
jgi:predicted aspartyl protease